MGYKVFSSQIVVLVSPRHIPVASPEDTYDGGTPTESEASRWEHDHRTVRGL